MVAMSPARVAELQCDSSGVRRDVTDQTGFEISMRIKSGVLSILALLVVGVLTIAPGSALARDPAGFVLMSTGKAVRMDVAGDVQSLSERQPVYEGDTLQTSAGASLQLKMVDNALLVLQSQTTVVLTRYQFDPSDAAGNAARIDLVEGRVRSVTGELGEGNHDAFRLNTPIAAIGIRGTDFETTTTEQMTRVRLNSGAIVFAPFGDDCAVSDLGPCASEGSLLITDDLAVPVAELRATDSAPRLLDLPELEEEQSGLINEESGEEQIGSERQAADLVGSISDGTAGGGDAGTGGGGGAGIPEFTPPALPGNWQDQIHWGRWENIEGLEGDTVDDLMAADKEVLSSNKLFVLFRDEFLSLGKGKAAFDLQAADAGILEGESFTPVALADGRLTIDFDQRSFETGLSFASDSVKDLNLRASGSVTSQGFLKSDAGNMWVRGGLAADNTEVGYLFGHQLSDSARLEGATQWQMR